MDLAATQFESTDIDAAVEFCYEQRWTDGLPVIGGDIVVALSPMAAKNLSSAGLTKMDVKQGGINLTKAGLPVMVFVYDNFERAARAQAKGLGVPDLRFYVYPQYTPGPDSLRDEESKASQAATDFAQLFHP